MDYWPYPPDEADRVDPFDSERTETQYILFGGHRPTSAFTDPALFDHRDLHQWIPMGYKILRRAQKVAILRNGDVVREWPVLHRIAHFESEFLPAGVAQSVNSWRRSVCGYHVLTSPTAMTAPEDAYDYAASIALARTASRTEGRALVVYMYAAENWH